MPNSHMIPPAAAGAVSMQASNYGYSVNSQQSYYGCESKPARAPKPDCLPRDHQSPNYLSPDDGSKQKNMSSRMSCGQYCTVEPSLATGGYRAHNPLSSLGYSTATGSPVSQHDSCVTEDPNELKQKLRELEALMLGPDSDIADSFESSVPNCLLSLEPEKLRQPVEFARSGLKDLLVACARAVEEKDAFSIEWMVAGLRQMVSVSGEPVQRLGAYMLEGLVARLASSGNTIYKALECKEPRSSDLLSYMHLLYEACPYFKFGYLSANGAIAEAVKEEKAIHIVDFQIAQGSQWVSLIQALAESPGGPPSIRITGIDDPVSAHARGGGLDLVGRRLSKIAGSCNIPFDFHAAAVSGSDVRLEQLGVRLGEAVVVNFAFQLHHVPDESVGTENHRDRILRLVKSLSPKVVTLVEQESNTNTAAFMPRFLETLDYYTAIFESIDVMLPRDDKERINVEQHCLARDIVNIIACEGAERVERHEVFGKWRSRFTMAGFQPCPLSPLVNTTIRALLENYSQNYRLEERDGVLYLGWMNRPLVVSCAWR